jgi:hypothetical protein
MTNDGAPDFTGLCGELADELDEVVVSADGADVAYTRGGAVFARASDQMLQVRLPVDIAEAALRTPDTSLDPDDRGWLRFSPGADAQHVADRTTAWFQTAWRHAADN